MKSILKKLPAVSVFIFLLFIYFLTTKGIKGNVDSSSTLLNTPFNGDISAFELSHERSSYATLLALDETHRTNLSFKLADAAAPDAGYYAGKLYSFFPPGVALVAWPLYILGKHFNLSLFFAYFTIAIIGALAMVVLYKISKNIFRLPTWLSLFITLAAGIGSPILNFSITFYQHIPTVFLILFGFYSTWKYKQKKKFSWLWAACAWGSYGVASFFDYPNLIVFLPILAYLIIAGLEFTTINRKFALNVRISMIATSIVLVIFGGLHMYYNYVTFGNFKQFSNSIPRYDPSKPQEDYESLQKQNSESIAKSNEALGRNLNEVRIVNGVNILLFDNGKSLLIHMPLYLLAILGIFAIRKKFNLEVGILISIVIINIMVYASFFDPWGGWGYGPRYLIPSIPIFCLFAGLWIANQKRFIFLKKTLLFLLFIYSSAVSILGAVGKNFLVAKIEAVYLNLPYKVWDNYRFIKAGINGTFAYNEFFRKSLSLENYYFILLSLVSIIGVFVLFILPRFEKELVAVVIKEGSSEAGIKPEPIAEKPVARKVRTPIVLRKKKKLIKKKRVLKW